MKNVLIVLLLAMVSQSAFAIGVRVINGTNNPDVQINPNWSGRRLDWVPLQESNYFKTGVHVLKGLYVY